MRNNMGRGMRRGGSNRGSGSNRGPANSRSMNAGNMDSPAPRPLMSSHLQDLDAELALLKLKREIIEQQQQILSGGDRFGRQSQYNYDQPQQSYSQRYKESASSSTKNFAHFYKDTSSSQSRQGTKRPAGDAWDRGTSAKRFSSNPPSQYRPPRQRYRPSAAESKPGSLPKGRKDFQPTKVTKPNKAKPPVNKNLVAKAGGAVDKDDTQDIVLRAGREPSRLMTGRMELALGAVLKEIREAHSDVMAKLNEQALRGVKQAIRERMRVALLNKPVDNVPNIVKAYRAQNPKETDAEVVKTGVASGNTRKSTRYVDPALHKLAMSLVKSGKPDIFFLENFNKKMSQRLDEMFAKLDSKYKREKAHISITQLMDIFMAEADLELFSEVEKEANADETKANETNSDDTVTEESKTNKSKADESITDETRTDDAKIDETKTDGAEVDETKTDDAKIDETKPDDIKTDDAKTDDTKNEITKANETNDNEETDENQVSNDNFTDTIDETSDNIENITEKDPPNDSTIEEVMDVDNSTDLDLNKTDSTNNVPDQKARKAHAPIIYFKLVKVMDTMIKRRLPILLPGYKNYIMSLFDAEKEYKKALAHNIVKAKKKVEPVSNKADGEVKKSGGKTLLFVKVFGRPNLPNRKEMQAFLDQYHPATIKKHRGIHNLLFVGFNTQEDYDKILAATDTVIDNCTLDIKESIKAKKDEQPGNKSGASEDDLKLDKELDDQINDLLNSIREDDEKRTKKAQAKRDSQNNESNDDVQVVENNAEKDVINVEDGQKPEEKKDKEATGVEKTTNDAVEGENKTTDNIADNAQLDDDITFVEEENNAAENNVETDETAEVPEETVSAKDNKVEAIKNQAKAIGGATPSKASGKVATSTPVAAPAVRTRRASRLAQNQNN